jgi:hypothetical protein
MKKIKLLLLLTLFTVYSSATLAIPSMKYKSNDKDDWSKVSKHYPLRIDLVVKAKHKIKLDNSVKFNSFKMPAKKMDKLFAQWPHNMKYKKWSRDMQLKKRSHDMSYNVPEPGMVGLLAIGLLGMVVVRRRLINK